MVGLPLGVPWPAIPRNMWKFWNGLECENSGIVQHLKILEWYRIYNFLKNPGHFTSRMVQKVPILEWSPIKKFWNGLECKISGMVRNIRIVEWFKKKIVARVQNVILLWGWSEFEQIGTGQVYNSSGKICN